MRRVDWYGCFDGSWVGELVEGAFAHPAKIPFALAERIYRHMLAEGWLRPGDRVVDPFAGIAGTAFHALLYGLHWEGVELESKFVALAQGNIILWNQRYAALMPRWGTATVYQGDSRKLASILADAQASVSSPPFLEGRESIRVQSNIVEDQHVGGAKDHRKEAYGSTPGQLGALPQGDFEAAVSSPPYSDAQASRDGDFTLRSTDTNPSPRRLDTRTYFPADMDTPGQLGALPQGDFEATVSSPPYSNALSAGEGPGARYDFKMHSPGNAIKQTCAPDYGDSDGQLGAMPTGDFDAAVSSPPYSESLTYQQPGAGGEGNELMRAGYTVQEIAEMRKNGDPRVLETRRNMGYSRDPANLGNLPAGGLDAAVSSPPYSETRIDGNGDEGASGLRNPDGSYLRGPDGWEKRKAMGRRYGETDGNLGNLPSGDHDAAVSSPPYAATEVTQRRNFLGGHGAVDVPANVPQSERQNGYGATDGQLGAMSQGDHDAAVSSPPYETSRTDGDYQRHAQNPDFSLNMPEDAKGYGESGIGRERTQEAADTFWSAARTIVEQTYAVLKPGGVAAWVTGDFVRNRKRVPFGEQWLALCESVGFEPLEWAVAWKEKDHGVQLDIFGNPVPLVTTRVSFFRRLANSKNPETAIVNEDVIFVRKPGGSHVAG